MGGPAPIVSAAMLRLTNEQRTAAGEAGDFDPAGAYPLIAEALADVWDDPRLEDYGDADKIGCVKESAADTPVPAWVPT